MGVKHTQHTADAVDQAVHLAGCRTVVSRGWADLAVQHPDVLVVDVSHEWLFPRGAAVVHHADAGTTAAGLRRRRAGHPVPFAYDQPFVAKRLHDLGVAPRVIPGKRLTATRLATAIIAALDPTARSVGRARRARPARRLARAG